MSTLFRPPMPTLTSRQALAWRLTAGQGATAEQVGIAVHAARGCHYCTNALVCAYAADDGARLLAGLRDKLKGSEAGLVRRRTRVWQHRNCSCPGCLAAGGQGEEIPF